MTFGEREGVKRSGELAKRKATIKVVAGGMALLVLVGIITGHLFYWIFCIELALIQDPEQGWAKRAEVVDTMSHFYGPSRDYAFDESLRYLARADRFGYFDCVHVNVRKSCFVGRSLHDLERSLRRPPDALSASAAEYRLGAEDSGRYVLHLALDAKEAITRVHVEMLDIK